MPGTTWLPVPIQFKYKKIYFNEIIIQSNKQKIETSTAASSY